MAAGFEKDDQGRLLPFGDGELHAGRYHMRLLANALGRAEHPIDPDELELVRRQILDIIKNSKSIRDRNAAAKTWAALDRNQLAWERHAVDMLRGPQPLVNINVHDQDATAHIDSVAQAAAAWGIDPRLLASTNGEQVSDFDGNSADAD